MKRWIIVAAALALAPLAASAQDVGPRVEQAWARATAGRSTTGAAYLTIESATPDELIGASTPVAGRAEIHSHSEENGVMRMRQVDAVPVRPGAPAVLKPGGNHIMLMDLKHPLKVGDSFPLTLRFAKAGDREVTIHVEKPGAAGPTAGHHHGPGHGS